MNPASLFQSLWSEAEVRCERSRRFQGVGVPPTPSTLRCYFFRVTKSIARRRDFGQPRSARSICSRWVSPRVWV